MASKIIYKNYELDSSGTVYSNKTNRQLKFNTSHSGYKSINICGKRVYIHRVVAETFIPNPENKSQVNHINGIKTDNRIENLEWMSASENIKDSYKRGRTTGKGINRSPKPLVLIKDLAIQEFNCIADAIKTIGGSHSGLSHVLHNRASTFKGHNAYFI